MCNGTLIGVVNRCSASSGVIDFSNKGISLFLEHLALHFHAWIRAKSANVKVGLQIYCLYTMFVFDSL